MAFSANVRLSRGLCTDFKTKRGITGTFRDAAKLAAALLLFSAAPALAIQHGGGGGGHAGGGGGHSGGGGAHPAGGAHPSSSARPSSAQHAPAPHPANAPPSRAGAMSPTSAHPTNARAGESTHVAQPGYVWEATPGYTNRVGPETPKNLGMRGYLWEEGPANSATGEKSYFLTTNLLPRNDAIATNGSAGGSFVARGSVSPHANSVVINRNPIPSASLVNRPARIIRTRPPFGFGRRRQFYGGFYPFGFFPGGFFGDCFAFGYDYSFGYGFGYPADPCGYGNLYPGYGYYSGGYYGGGNYSDFSGQVTNDMAPYSAPSEDEAVAPEGAEAPTAGPDVTVLYLKDGSSFGVSDYWIEGGRLHYVTTYGGANAVDLDELDTQRTVDDNAKQGVTFTLRPPHSQDQQAQPQKQQN
jgi:hypothetical protein